MVALLDSNLAGLDLDFYRSYSFSLIVEQINSCYPIYDESFLTCKISKFEIRQKAPSIKMNE